MSHAAELLARRQSVTQEDNNTGLNGAGFLYVYPLSGAGQSVPGLPAYWSPGRDIALKQTLVLESMWASAVYKGISKQTALGFTVDDSQDKEKRARRAQSLFLHADYVKGRTVGGWVPFLTRHLIDVLLTDNGGFVEVIRASPARGSRILGLAHLDSYRCERTGNPEQPVIYRDLQGHRHILREHQVLCYADMAGGLMESFNKLEIGFCAASRAYKVIARQAAIEQYLLEKITGSRATALYFIGPMSPNTLDSALKTSDEAQARKGMQVFKGANIITTPANEPLSLVTIPLSEVPDGFDAERERANAYVVYANALGVPVQDIQPLSGQGLGTGTQTVILAEAAEGQGLAAWRKWWEQAFNEMVLSETTTFTFATNDIRDQRAKAEVAQIREATRASMLETQQITLEEARQMAADSGDIPKEFLAQDQTPGGTLDDTDKPVASVEEQPTEEPIQPDTNTSDFEVTGG